MPEGDDGLKSGGRSQQDRAGPLGHGAAAQRKAGDGDDGKRPGGDRCGSQGAAGFVAQGETGPAGGIGEGVGVLPEGGGRALVAGEAPVLHRVVAFTVGPTRWENGERAH